MFQSAVAEHDEIIVAQTAFDVFIIVYVSTADNNTTFHFDTYTLQVDGKDNSGGRIYLFIKDKLPKFKQVDGIDISYSSIEELISMLSGKRLIYYNKFAEDHCNVEDTVNRHMQDDVFNLITHFSFFLNPTSTI